MGMIALSDFIIKGAIISCGSSGANQIVSAVPTKRITVVQCALSSSGIVNVHFTSSSGGTDLTGPIYLIAGSDFELGSSQIAWFATVPGEGLFLSLSGSVNVGGVLSYVET